MHSKNEKLNALVQRQLELDARVVEALEQLNDKMSALLDQSGIYGPAQTELETLSPLMDNLKRRYLSSSQSREKLMGQCDLSSTETLDKSEEQESLRSVIETLPKRQAEKLHRRRQEIHNRLQEAEQKLTANQVVIFYSTEFHRRYLQGVLQCNVNDANYKADGQAFKLPPEKIFGRNC